ncbi:O-methyltransferase [bacterium]|nr:MAG: O-methyltransferase [bacterium]
MDQDLWSAVDAYLDAKLISPDTTLDAALEAVVAAGMPPISVSPTQGKLLYLLANLKGARRILEVGTLGGYSSIWLARSLPPEGRLVTLELERKHAEVAQANVDRAGLRDRVEILVGPAAQTMPGLDGPFDMVFIDADKPSIPIYWAEALRLTGPGALIIVDNVVRNGAVVDASSQDASVQGVRAFMEMLAEESRVETTAVQTVGAKGYDGFVIAIMK